MLAERKKLYNNSAVPEVAAGLVGDGGECSTMMIGGQGTAVVVQDTIAATTIARWSRVIYKPGKGRNAPN